MNKSKAVATISALSTLSFGAVAQPANGALEEIIVTATRIEQSINTVPAAISVVGQEDIQLARQQLALDESLTRVPGLFMQNRYNFAQDLRVSIRGFGARANFGIRGVKILVDGIPETLPDGQGSVDGIDIGSTGQIEVLRGPSSSLYGNASGGVISVISETPPEEGMSQLRISAGDYGFHKLQAKFGGSGEKLGYVVSVSDSVIDGYREQSRAENTQLSTRLNFDLGDDRTLLAAFNYTDQPISDDPGGVNAAQAAADPTSARDLNLLYDAGEYLEQVRLGFVYSMPLGQQGTLTARNYYVTRDFGNSLPFLAGGQVELDRFFAGGGLTYSRTSKVGNHDNDLVVGFDYDHQDDDRYRYDNINGVRGQLAFDQNETVNSRGIYLQDVLHVTDAVAVTLGVRMDDIEYDVSDRFLLDGQDDSGTVQFNDTSPMAGVSFAATDELTFYANYSTSFETPTTTELARPDASGGFDPNLNSQTARNIEVGLRGTASDRHRYEVSLFDIEVDDELVPYEVAAFPGREFFRNAATSSRQGMEFSLSSRLTDNLRSVLTYTYSDFKFDDFPVFDSSGAVTDNFAGSVIPGSAEDVLFGELTYAHPSGWFASVDVLYVSEQFANNTNSTVVDGYTVSNVRFGANFELGSTHVSPFIGINNLTDETYFSNIRINAFGGRFYEPAPDRNFYAGITIDFGR